MAVVKQDLSLPSGQYAPFAVVTNTDHTAWIIITTAFGMTAALVFGSIRIFVRMTINRPFGLDDILLGAATLLAFVQTSVVLGGCSKGLGRSIELISIDDQNGVQKLWYAGSLLCIVALGVSKLSVIGFLWRLSPARRHKMVFRLATGVIVAWTVASVCAVALQCNLSRPWKSLDEDCPGSLLRWQTICVTDMLTEIGMVASVVYLVRSLQISSKKRMTVVGVFSFRLLMLVVIGFRLETFSVDGFTENPTFSEDYFIVWTQVELYYSLASATIPILRPFMRNLNTMHGGLGAEGTTNATGSYSESGTRYVGNYQLSKLRPKLGPSHTKSVVGEEDEESIIPSGSGNKIGRTVTHQDGMFSTCHIIGEGDIEVTVKADSTSVNSDESRQMMIRKDVTWEVVHEET